MEPDPPAEDVAFAKSFFSQFASIHKQRDSPADEFASRFAESNAILVLKKPSRKRDRARDPGVVAQRKLRRRRTKALAKKMSHRQLKADGLYDVNLEGRTYTDMLWMNALWEQYMGWSGQRWEGGVRHSPVPLMCSARVGALCWQACCGRVHRPADAQGRSARSVHQGPRRGSGGGGGLWVPSH